jgi:hypothetical protein
VIDNYSVACYKNHFYNYNFIWRITMSPISGSGSGAASSSITSSPKTDFSAQSQPSASDKPSETTSAESVDKSSFGGADMPVSSPDKAAGADSAAGGEKAGGLEDILKLLKTLFEGLLKLLGGDKSEEGGAADSSQGATNAAAKDSPAMSA